MGIRGPIDVLLNITQFLELRDVVRLTMADPLLYRTSLTLSSFWSYRLGNKEIQPIHLPRLAQREEYTASEWREAAIKATRPVRSRLQITSSIPFQYPDFTSWAHASSTRWFFLWSRDDQASENQDKTLDASQERLIVYAVDLFTGQRVEGHINFDSQSHIYDLNMRAEAINGSSDEVILVLCPQPYSSNDNSTPSFVVHRVKFQANYCSPSDTISPSLRMSSVLSKNHRPRRGVIESYTFAIDQNVIVVVVDEDESMLYLWDWENDLATLLYFPSPTIMPISSLSFKDGIIVTSRGWDVIAVNARRLFEKYSVESPARVGDQDVAIFRSTLGISIPGGFVPSSHFYPSRPSNHISTIGVLCDSTFNTYFILLELNAIRSHFEQAGTNNPTPVVAKIIVGYSPKLFGLHSAPFAMSSSGRAILEEETNQSLGHDLTLYRLLPSEQETHTMQWRKDTLEVPLESNNFSDEVFLLDFEAGIAVLAVYDDLYISRSVVAVFFS